MELKWKLHQYSFRPADYTETVAEVKAIMDVHRGTWVKGVMLRIGTAFNSTPAIAIGDGYAEGPEEGEYNGFFTTAEADITVAGLKNGLGAYLTNGVNGKLYTEDDTIDLIYYGIAGVTQGLATVYVVYCEIE